MDKLGLNFGLVIAYLIPGFSATYALAPHVKAIDALLGGSERVPSANAVVPLILMAVAVGIIINAISEVAIRPLIHRSGVKQPKVDTEKLTSEGRRRYDRMIENHFRYHQFFSNMLVSVLLLGPVWLLWPLHNNILRNASLPMVVVALFLTARKALFHFYTGRSTLSDEDSESQSS